MKSRPSAHRSRSSKSAASDGSASKFAITDWENDDWSANIDEEEPDSRRIRSIENIPQPAALSRVHSSTSSIAPSKSPHSRDCSVDSRAQNDAQLNAEIEEINARLARITKFKSILRQPVIDLAALRKLAWAGIPDELRPQAWKLLLGYLPKNSNRREETLRRKRQDYLDGLETVFSRPLDQVMWHQISIDVPRTNPHIPLYTHHTTQKALERILYLWAVRHPASGYVQGINDLVTPFFQVFLSEYIDADDITDYDPKSLAKNDLNAIEADCYWCLTKLLDGIQDNYIQAQPGIQRQVAELRDLTKRIDSTLAAHLEHENVEFIQFSFRWMNCLLMRELSIDNIIRMWDTYMAEEPLGFSRFHVFVCAALLVKFSSELQQMDFQDIMIFLQSIPTGDWDEKNVELLLSEAYMWQTLFKDSSAHLKDNE
ncbi:hypothetical protein CANCADRAFT_23950 [Tortispora caseinolytica NRRL Y-17796]|uniref:Rab-GAP TBC domain-containing protein n=1 Tax=Tortispora caseinolytica NRRL Y-17796 TaxID=767744 RepID=A0A1E4TFV2_9ASCO|nr:hypothetical protein CANCADRAFT_23950 [Tortispora caseinolytica NRRL Y-17796]